MKLLTKAMADKLLENGRKQAATEHHLDPFPVVKLFTPDGAATWLLTEIDPDDPSIAFGLCDLGLGFPELGNVSLVEIAALRGALGLPVERDRWFKADKPLSAYAEIARQNGRIIA